MKQHFRSVSVKRHTASGRTRTLAVECCEPGREGLTYLLMRPRMVGLQKHFPLGWMRVTESSFKVVELQEKSPADCQTSALRDAVLCLLWNSEPAFYLCEGWGCWRRRPWLTPVQSGETDGTELRGCVTILMQCLLIRSHVQFKWLSLCHMLTYINLYKPVGLINDQKSI